LHWSKKVKQILLLLVLAGMSHYSYSHAPVFKDNSITFSGIGVIDGDNNSFYGDIQLNHEGDGLFRLVQAEPRDLVPLHFIHMAVNETYHQAVVSVEGYKSNPCVILLDPAVHLEGNHFTVLLAESQLGPAETCIAQADLFTIGIALELKGLGPGDFTISVNNVAAEFTLEMSN